MSGLITALERGMWRGLLLVLALIAIAPTVLAMMLVGLVAQKARELVSRRRMMRGLDELLREDTP